MKKFLMIVGIIVVFIAMIIGGMFLFKIIFDTSENNNVNDPASGDLTNSEASDATVSMIESADFSTILRATSVNKLKETAEKLEIVVEDYNDGKSKGFMVNEDPIITAVYEMDSNRITRTYVLIEPKDDIDVKAEGAVEIVKSDAIDTVILCEKFFGTSCYEHFQIIHDESLYLTLDDEDTYKYLLEGKCYLQLFLREADGTMWRMDGRVQEGKYIMTMTRYFDLELFKNITAEITLK